MVDTCPSGQKCNTLEIDKKDGLFPHSYLNDGRIYLNRECGVCNSATKIIPWRVGFVCSQTRYCDMYYTHSVCHFQSCIFTIFHSFVTNNKM